MDMDMDMVIADAGPERIDGWMQLVEAVRDNFPGLETEEKMREHRRTVEKFMRRGEAICAVEGGRVVGALLYSSKQNLLCFLAVDPQCRRRGVAKRMVEKMLTKMPDGDVRVQTFREGDPRGAAARPFYRALGFAPDRLSDFEGYPEQDFVLKR
jgi:ribosomal protein S18 acetylase RimI-like enzyme